jgi:hypothetical protein
MPSCKLKKIIKQLIPDIILFCIERLKKNDLKEYIAFKYQFKHAPSPSEFAQYLSVVAIVKNEVFYIAEWIEYHLLVGVEKFYIYDNESDDGLKEYLDPYIKEGIVEYTFSPGKTQQHACYHHAITNHKFKSFWIAFIDIDEFIVPISTKTIPDFLHDFEDVPGIEINWMNYGSSGHKTKTPGLVIERFKDHAEINDKYKKNRLIKSIVNPRLVFKNYAHIAEYINGKRAVDTNKKSHKDGATERPPLFNKMRINHYYTKSYEEFLNRLIRGSNSKKYLRTIEEFTRRDYNEVKNDPIMDKYILLIKENIQKRFVTGSYTEKL